MHGEDTFKTVFLRNVRETRVVSLLVIAGRGQPGQSLVICRGVCAS